MSQDLVYRTELTPPLPGAERGRLPREAGRRLSRDLVHLSRCAAVRRLASALAASASRRATGRRHLPEHPADARSALRHPAGRRHDGPDQHSLGRDRLHPEPLRLEGAAGRHRAVVGGRALPGPARDRQDDRQHRRPRARIGRSARHSTGRVRGVPGDRSEAPIAIPVEDEYETISINYTSGHHRPSEGRDGPPSRRLPERPRRVHDQRIVSDSRYLWTLPMFHCNGWCCTWGVTAVGGTHVCLRRVGPRRDLAADPR